MIKEIILENIKIDGTEKSLMKTKISGKILKVLYQPVINLNVETTFKLFTKENEQVLNVKEEGVYYPRANISTQKMDIDSVDLSGDKTDYFYFNKFLIFKFLTNTEVEDKVVVDKVVIIYEE